MVRAMAKPAPAVFLLALATVSTGDVIDGLKPDVPVGFEELVLQTEKKRQHLKEMKAQYEQAQTNFDEFQLSAPTERARLQSEVSQLEAAVEKATMASDKLADDNKRMRERTELFARVATDEQKMYSSRLAICTSSGQNPKSFIGEPEPPKGHGRNGGVPGVRPHHEQHAQQGQPQSGKGKSQVKGKGKNQGQLLKGKGKRAAGSVPGVHPARAMPTFQHPKSKAPAAPGRVRPTRKPTAAPRAVNGRRAPARRLRTTTPAPAPSATARAPATTPRPTPAAPLTTLRPSLAAGVWKDPHNQTRAYPAQRKTAKAATQALTPCPVSQEDVVAKEVFLKKLMEEHEAWEARRVQAGEDIAELEKGKAQKDQEKMALLERKLQLVQPGSPAAGQAA